MGHSERTLPLPPLPAVITVPVDINRTPSIIYYHHPYYWSTSVRPSDCWNYKKCRTNADNCAAVRLTFRAENWHTGCYSCPIERSCQFWFSLHLFLFSSCEPMWDRRRNGRTGKTRNAAYQDRRTIAVATACSLTVCVQMTAWSQGADTSRNNRDKVEQSGAVAGAVWTDGQDRSLQRQHPVDAFLRARLLVAVRGLYYITNISRHYHHHHHHHHHHQQQQQRPRLPLVPFPLRCIAVLCLALTTLLAPCRDTSVTSRLRSCTPLPRPTSRTKKFQSFINFALNKYQSPI